MDTQNIPTCINQFSGDLSGKRVVVRAELNAPIKDGLVGDDFRIKKFLPTLQYLEGKGAVIIVLAHMGRDLDDTLEPVADYLADHVHNMMFYKNFFHSYGQEEFEVNVRTLKDDLDQAEPGNIFLLDNVRQTKKEKENDEELAKIIAELGDVYVHEAFPAAHRKHVSTYGVPSLFELDSKYSGLTFHMEQKMLSTALEPVSPSLFVLGGAKFETKLPLIESFLGLYDHVLIGGALANNMFKLAGYNVGESLIEELTKSQEESLTRVLQNKKFILPNIVTCETITGDKIDKQISDILDTDKIYDIAPTFLDSITDIVATSKTILWNGPLGYYEGGYDAGTKKLAELVASSDSISIAGGGDTIDAIHDINVEDNFDFLSSAGGAMIDYLSDADLPGINILLDK